MLLVSEQNEILTVYCGHMGDVKTGQGDQHHEPTKREETAFLQCNTMLLMF